MSEETATNAQETQQQETKWYVLRVVSGKERKVKEYLDKEISRGGWAMWLNRFFCRLKKYIKFRMVKK